MFVYLSFYTLYHCIYIPKIVKKLRIHQSYSLNPHFYIRSIHSPPKNTPKHQVYTLAKHFKTCFQVISLFKRLFSPLWLEVPNPQKQRKYRLFQPLSFVIRAIHSTWNVPEKRSVCPGIFPAGYSSGSFRYSTHISFNQPSSMALSLPLYGTVLADPILVAVSGRLQFFHALYPF